MSANPSLEQRKQSNPAAAKKPSSRGRTLVLVVGSGRSGTSLVTGILQRLGFHVPQPEVPADETNPRGFAESQWVVDFHSRLLRDIDVRTSDARPQAWGLVAERILDGEVSRALREWLAAQFDQSDHVIVKDPRLSWFLPLWRRGATELGVMPRFVMMLRHPAAVIDSKQRWYGGWHGDVGHTAAWLNASLFTERATREGPRAIVRYDDLLQDWTQVVGQLGEALDLQLVRDAPARAVVRVHEFVDQSLSRSKASWDGINLPEALRAQAQDLWELLGEVAGAGEPLPEELAERLERARRAYLDLYEEAEAIASSSIEAARRDRNGRGKRERTAVRVAGALPQPVRRLVPVRWKRAIYGSFVRRRASSRGESK